MSQTQQAGVRPVVLTRHQLYTWHCYHEKNLLLWARQGQKVSEESDSKTSFEFGGLGAEMSVLK